MDREKGRIRKQGMWLAAAIFALAISGCASSVTSHGGKSGTPKSSVACDTVIYPHSLPIENKISHLGSVDVGDTGFTVDCSPMTVLGHIRQNACERGADAVRVTELKSPTFMVSTCFRARADLYTVSPNPWAGMSITRAGFEKDISQREWEGTLRQVEGIWQTTDKNYTIGVQYSSDRGEPEVLVLIVSSPFPDWRQSQMKARFQDTQHEGFYLGHWLLRSRLLVPASLYVDQRGMLRVDFEGGTAKDVENFKLIRIFPR